LELLKEFPTLDRALFILAEALEKSAEDGLTKTEIHEILPEGDESP
jgi:hypothetical protein